MVSPDCTLFRVCNDRGREMCLCDCVLYNLEKCVAVGKLKVHKVRTEKGRKIWIIGRCCRSCHRVRTCFCLQHEPLLKALLDKNCIFNKAPVASSVTPTARTALRCQFSSLSCSHLPSYFSFDVVVSWQVFNEDPFSFVYNVCPSEAENPSVPCGQNVSCIFTLFALKSNWFIYF